MPTCFVPCTSAQWRDFSPVLDKDSRSWLDNPLPWTWSFSTEKFSFLGKSLKVDLMYTEASIASNPLSVVSISFLWENPLSTPLSAVEKGVGEAHPIPTEQKRQLPTSLLWLSTSDSEGTALGRHLHTGTAAQAWWIGLATSGRQKYSEVEGQDWSSQKAVEGSKMTAPCAPRWYSAPNLHFPLFCSARQNFSSNLARQVASVVSDSWQPHGL